MNFDVTAMQNTIEQSFEQITQISPEDQNQPVGQAVNNALQALNQGQLRVAEKINGQWQTHQWLKKAILLSFRLFANEYSFDGVHAYYDKVPPKFTDANAEELRHSGIRVVPPAYIRSASYIGPSSVIMPSFVNTGVFIDSGTMIDTWATVGACAQVGKNVHLSGGAGLGGILEPLQATPTIVEDNCFIGARSEIVEGVIVEQGSILSMGVFIGQSTPIYDRQTGETFFGRVPAGSVVVPGTIPSSQGDCHLYCAIIVKQVDDQTRQKVSVNQLLRQAHQ